MARDPDHNPPPTVDPTVLTTDAVNAATGQWRRELALSEEIVRARLDAMDKAETLHRQFADDAIKNMPNLITNLQDLTEEKFSSINRQFLERDTRTDQTQRASKEALDAALLAAKELVNTQNESNAKSAEKTEASFSKQIEQIGDLIRTGNSATAQQLADLKERIDRSEGGVSGRAGQVIETREARTDVLGQRNSNVQVLGAVIAAAAILVTILLALYFTKP